MQDQIKYTQLNNAFVGKNLITIFQETKIN